MARKKKQRSLLAAMLDALLTLIDWICESVASAVVGLLGALARGIWALVRGVVWLLARLCGAVLAVPLWAIRKMTAPKNGAAKCLRLDGQEFEEYVALVLKDNGFRHVELTKGSGDQGVDILAERNGTTYAIQCKNYDGAVGNFAVQEAYAGAQFYDCDTAVVICPGTFTRGAVELAESTGVKLWDGRKLSRMMKVSGRRPPRRK